MPMNSKKNLFSATSIKAAHKKIRSNLFVFILGLVLGIILSQNSEFIEFLNQTQFSFKSQPFYEPNISKDLKADFKKYALPQCLSIRCYGDYVLTYDPRTKNPLWVYEILSPDSLSYSQSSDISRQHSEFKEDHSIPSFHRARLIDYKKSGFSRGHLAAAANHKSSQKHLDATFILSNISPQYAQLNLGAWNSLEQWTRTQVRKKKFTAYIISAPLFLAQNDKSNISSVSYQVLGQSQVAVPTHFLKVIRYEYQGKIAETLAFILPNHESVAKRTFWEYQVSLEEAQAKSGLLFFQVNPSPSKLN
jgi:endonuclease G